MSSRRLHLTRRGSVGLAATLVALSLSAVVEAGAGTARAAVAAPAASQAAPAVAVDDPAVTRSKTVARTYVNADGSVTPVESKNVSVTVNTTQNLRSRQVLTVSWSGAHPTGGIAADPNSADARSEEYPFLVFECRGVDDPSAPAAQQISQQTCWSQTPRERYESDFNNSFPPYRVDQYATPADRAQVAGKPAAVTCDPSAGSAAEHFQPFVSVSGSTYAQGSGKCLSIAPEQTTTGTTSGRPANTTYAATGVDGTGTTRFTTWTSEDNTSLGCTDTVACTLVAVPIMGVSCDPTGALLPADDVADRPSGQQVDDATAACEANGRFAPGSYNNGNQNPTQAVAGDLWWSASNWRNRISFPLSFAPLSTLCNNVSSGPTVQVYGSELLTQATSQWAPKLCTQSDAYVLRHVQTGEPQARNIVNTGNAEAAFTTETPTGGFATPTVTAPTAITGFTFAYAIDDKNKAPVTDLKLTPRLIAKLMTESYPAELQVQQGEQALSKNPLDVALDPEFQALNPTVDPNLSAQDAAAAALILSSDSDVIRAVTDYIAADPEAMAWLRGAPDPWGMVVNPAYQLGLPTSTLTLPTESWPLLDTFKPDNPQDQCQVDDPVPFLPLVAAPTQRLATISQNLQYNIAASQTVCQSNGYANQDKRVAEGRQSSGSRFVIGLTSLGDAARFDLATAALETHTAADAPVRFTDATGRSFAGPDDTALKAAINSATPNAATNTWDVDRQALRSDPVHANAYPGTMLVSTSIPTKGLPAADATTYAKFLRFVAGDGQTRGDDIGELPAGYLPMTSGNGQGRFVSYTSLAADAVGAQAGDVPQVVPVTAGAPAATPSTGSASAPAGSAPSASGGTGATAAARTSPAAPTGVRASSSTRSLTTAPGRASTPPGTAVAPVPSTGPSPMPGAQAPAAGDQADGGALAAVPASEPDAPAVDPGSAAGPGAGSSTDVEPGASPVLPLAAAVSAGKTPTTASGSRGLVLPLLLLVAVAGMILLAGDVLAGRRKAPGQ